MYDLKFYHWLLLHRPKIIRIEFNRIMISRLTAEQAHPLNCNHIIIRNTIKREHKVCRSYFDVSVIDFCLNGSIDCSFNITEDIIFRIL